MQVELLNHTPLFIASKAIRTCWDSHDKSDTETTTNTFLEFGGGRDIQSIPINEIECGEKDKELIDRVGNKNKHSSTLEHLVYTFYISNISRALLQELARHRIASLSVKSTRYTLNKLKDEKLFIITAYDEPDELELHRNLDRASTYLVMTNDIRVDIASMEALNNIVRLLKQGVSNDKVKYALPESFKTELTWTINARSLQNFLYLRTDKSALWEIQELAHAIYGTIPYEHRYLFEGYMK